MSQRVGRSFVAALLIVFAAAAALRCAWLTADPPTQPLSASSGTTKARGCTTREIVRCGGLANRRVEPGVRRAGLHRARVRGVSRRSASARGRRAPCPLVSGLLAVALLAIGLCAVAGRRAALIGACTSGDQLRLRHVESRGPDGVDDDGVHRVELGSVHPRRTSALPSGLACRCRRDAGLVLESRGRVLRRRARPRLARHDPRARACGAVRSGRRSREPRRLPFARPSGH